MKRQIARLKIFLSMAFSKLSRSNIKRGYWTRKECFRNAWGASLMMVDGGAGRASWNYILTGRDQTAR